jgi:hypothetical protein
MVNICGGCVMAERRSTENSSTEREERSDRDNVAV